MSRGMVSAGAVSRLLRMIAALIAVAAATAVLLTGLAAGADAARTAVLGTPASQPTGESQHYRSTVSGIQPAVAGLNVSVLPGGTLRLTNTTGHTVTVFGYDGQPYLRISSHGVDENVNSLSSALSSGDTGAVDDRRTPAPRWRHRDPGSTVTWRDYRVRPASTHRPPAVAANPHRAQRVSTWALRLTVGDQPVQVMGAVDWTGIPRFSDRQFALLIIAGVVVLGLAILLIAQSIDRRTGRRTCSAVDADATGDPDRLNGSNLANQADQADWSSRSSRAARSQFTRSPDFTTTA